MLLDLQVKSVSPNPINYLMQDKMGEQVHLMQMDLAYMEQADQTLRFFFISEQNLVRYLEYLAFTSPKADGEFFEMGFFRSITKDTQNLDIQPCDSKSVQII